MKLPRQSMFKATAIAVAISNLLVGCAYVAPLRAPLAESPPSSLRSKYENSSPKCATAGCLEEAIMYGESWQRHYYGMASQSTTFTRLLPAPILPLSSIAAYRATGVKPDLHLARGYALTAAALYVAGSYAGGSTDAEIHLEGARGLSCVLNKARPLAIKEADLARLAEEHDKFVAAFAKAQGLYTTLRTSPALRAETDGDKAAYKAVQEEIYSRIDKRLRYYDRVLQSSGRAIAELKGVGDRTRGLIDEVVLNTATELAKAAPDLAKLKTLLGELPGLATALGSLPEEPSEDSGSTPTAPSSSPPPASAPPAAAPTSEGGTPASPSAKPEAKEENVKTGKTLSDKPVVEAEKKWVKTTPVKSKEATSALQRVATIMENNTGSLSYVVTKDGIAIEGVLTRPQSRAEIDAAEKAQEKKDAEAKKAQERKDAEAKKVADETNAKKIKEATDRIATLTKIREIKAFKDLHAIFGSLAERAHTIRAKVSAWANPKSITVGCEDGEPNEGADVFRVTPSLDKKELTVGEEFKVSVQNARIIPTVAIVGDNAEKLAAVSTLTGDAFIVTIKATHAIPADKPAILAINGYNGRTIRTSFSAKAIPKAASSQEPK